MVNQFKLKPLSLAIASLFVVSGVSYAAENEVKDEKAKDKKDVVEVIEVTGYRGSILRSISDKRNSSGIVDSIFAEDIGKNTDQNIADALSRVTGVSIQTEDGEGTRISVRGTEASFNNISLNGVQLTSNDGSSAVDLSGFSSDILASIQVYKTSSADQDEGALGANVVLKTPSPLSFDKDRRQLEVQYRYNEFSEKDNNKISGTFSHKFTDNFAAMITGTTETQDIRRDQFQTSPEEIFAQGGRYSTTDGSDNSAGVGGMVYKEMKYQMFQNTRDRDSLNAVFQYVPAEDTEIKLSLSAFNQTVHTNNQELMMSPLYASGYVRDIDESTGNVDGDNYYDPTPGSDGGDRVLDPQEDWWTLDPNNKRFVKFLNRQSFGRNNESVSINETKNKVATLSLSHYFTDNFRMDLSAGLSKTDLDLLPGSGNTLGISTRRLTNNQKFEIPSDQIIPNGYDCTLGRCQMVVVPPDLTLGAQPDGVAGSSASAFGGYSPTDPYANTVQQITRTNRSTKDTNKSIYLDFDWDLDHENINQIEFGGKWAQRVKEFESQWYQVTNATTQHFDTSQVDENGNFKQLTPVDTWQVFSQIPIADVAREQPFVPDGFMEGLVGTNSAYSSDMLNGWYLIDTQKAAVRLYEEYYDGEDIRFENLLWVPENTTRADVEQETSSLYAKADFSFMDGRLTGDIGLRYVRTEVEVLRDQTAVNYHGSPNMWTWHELRDAGLFGGGADECSSFQASSPDEYSQVVRIDQGPAGNPVEWRDSFDGTFQVVNRYDANGNPIILPDKKAFDGGVIYTDVVRGGDPLVAGDFVEAQYSIDPNSSLKCVDQNFATLANPWTSNSSPLTRPDIHSDLSTAAVTGNQARQYDATLKHTYTNLLPSFNLNYLIKEDLIGRFAVSQTMARPKFEDVRGGFTFRETEQSDQHNIRNASDAELDAMVSTNLDLSLEWYFNKSSQLSLSYFKKDIKDYVDKINTDVYVTDIRRNLDIETLTLEDFIIPIVESESAKAEADKLRPGETLDSIGMEGDQRMCHPDRITNLTWENPSEWINQCAIVNLEYKLNGAKAKVEGIEFTYRQTYDFLPGLLSGLGSNVNYTYAKSSSNPGTLTITGDSDVSSVPQAFTPQHTLNTSLYWEKSGHSVRLTHRYNSVQFVGRQFSDYLEWQDAKESLDLAINYKFNKNLSFRFDGLNLTDTKVRTFLTADKVKLDRINESGEREQYVYKQGNPMTDSSVDTSFTRTEYRTGRHYRLSLRLNF
ncbi:TonB-dependent receptor [Colwellia sp. RE-S-Sl-9]